ncbi:397c17b3-1913-4a60-84b2-c04c7b11fdb7 [Thermothielavioides terrestris]|uniref:397c17b3-1913-4a60-84b2-c04c7b11fdb7 n=1 Tax=Thermothielavioides terrestris TaxID=2587410 RepID=A0A446BQD5_9PEZI|nr:397c17b3-1913-4a60-84b2-c04c7b11fdb7 [Thermothielavioides terrestris]
MPISLLNPGQPCPIRSLHTITRDKERGRLPAAQLPPEPPIPPTDAIALDIRAARAHRPALTTGPTTSPLLVPLVLPGGRQRRQRLGHAPAAGGQLGVGGARGGQAAGLDDAAHQQREGLLDVDLEPRARLHEAAAAPARPLEPHRGGDLPAVLQVALVAGHDLDWRHRLGAGAGAARRQPVVQQVVVVRGVARVRQRRRHVQAGQAGAAGAGRVVEPRLGFHVDQLVEVVERVERGARRDVVDEQEGVGAQVRRRPHAAVLLLAGRVGQAEVVHHAVDPARHAVAVLDRRVVLARPLAPDQAQGDGGLAAAAVAADGDGDGHRQLRGVRRRWRVHGFHISYFFFFFSFFFPFGGG